MSGYGASLIANSDTAVLVALILFIPLLILFTLRVSAGLRTPLRAIAPWRALPPLSQHSTETGEPVVLWLADGLQDERLRLPASSTSHSASQPQATQSALSRRIRRVGRAAST